MKDYAKNLGSFWNKCSTDFAHINSKWKKLPNPSKWEKGFKKHYEWADINKLFNQSVVVDYGIGSGHLGYVLHNFGIKKYVGIDIAKRQLDVARAMLESHKEICEFHLAPVTFSTLNADVFICHACIQHFPNENYLKEFLSNLNSSDIKYLFLQYRHSDPAKFTEDNPRLACKINSKYLSNELQKYKLINLSDVNNGNNYQYSCWKIL